MRRPGPRRAGWSYSLENVVFCVKSHRSSLLLWTQNALRVSVSEQMVLARSMEGSITTGDVRNRVTSKRRCKKHPEHICRERDSSCLVFVR